MQQAQAGVPPALMSNPTHLEQYMQRCWQHACHGSSFLNGMLSQCGLVLHCHSAGGGGGSAGHGRRQRY